jgi:16S rRNA processing protein RimM
LTGDPSNSPASSGQRITVGVVRRPHGIRGGILVAPTSDDPSRFAVGSVLRIEGAAGDVAVVGSQPHPEGVIVYVEGVVDRTAAEGLRRSELTIAVEDRRSLGDDEYWPEDLVGLPATTPDGIVLGLVTDVVLGASQDRLVVTTAAGDVVEVPFVTALVPEVTSASVTVDPPVELFPG